MPVGRIRTPGVAVLLDTPQTRVDMLFTDFNGLLDDALCVLAYHGHTIPREWETFSTSPNQHVRITCPACRMSVDVVERPDTGGTNICGDAVANRCTGRVR